MDKKAEGLLISVTTLLLYMKFGSLVFWFFGIMLATCTFLAIAFMEFLRFCMPTYYKKACELHKRKLGYAYIEVVPCLEINTTFNKKAVVRVVLATVLSAIFFWLIYVRLIKLLSPR